MRGPRFFISMALIASILIGVAWGLKIRRDRLLREALHKDKPQLTVLALTGVFTPSLLEKFEASSGVRVVLTEAPTPEEIWAKLEAAGPQAPTLVSLFSFQLPLASQMTRIQPIPFQRLTMLRAISPDFREIPDSSAFRESMPLLWGLEGLLYDSSEYDSAPEGWADVLKEASAKEPLAIPSSTTFISRLSDLTQTKTQSKDLSKQLEPVLSKLKIADSPLSPASLFKNEDSQPDVAMISHGEMAFPPFNNGKYKFALPAEGYNLWILSLSLTTAATPPRVDVALQFLDFLLRQESAIEITEYFHQASANRELEKSTLDRKLKPSFLRQVSLSNYKLGQDFNRAREIRKLLDTERK